MIHILTDSTADLSPELMDRYRIQVLPLNVFINNRTYRDGIDISLEELFELAETTEQLPKTTSVSLAEFSESFEQPGEIIYIGISSRLSTTVSEAILAAEMLPERAIHVIDGLNLSTGTGHLVLRAAELREQGASAGEIVEEVHRLIPHLRTSFVVDTMDYLYMGGRCSALQNVIGSLLHIRPVIEVQPDGTLDVKEKIRGSRKKALDSMLADFQAHLPNIDRHRVFITHTGCDADADYLANEIKQMARFDEVCTTRAGAVIASHCGPDTIGILYICNP